MYCQSDITLLLINWRALTKADRRHKSSQINLFAFAFTFWYLWSVTLYGHREYGSTMCLMKFQTLFSVSYWQKFNLKTNEWKRSTETCGQLYEYWGNWRTKQLKIEDFQVAGDQNEIFPDANTLGISDKLKAFIQSTAVGATKWMCRVMTVNVFVWIGWNSMRLWHSRRIFHLRAARSVANLSRLSNYSFGSISIAINQVPFPRRATIPFFQRVVVIYCIGIEFDWKTHSISWLYFVSIQLIFGSECRCCCCVSNRQIDCLVLKIFCIENRWSWISSKHAITVRD